MNAPAELSQVTLSVQEAFERGFNDLQFFARVALPDTVEFDFPDHFVAIWVMLVNALSASERARILRYALGLPRGFAKTTFIKVIVAWLIVYDKTNFILTVCATEPLAQLFVEDVNAILSSPNMERIYGAWKANLAVDSKEMKKCAYRRRIVIIMAIGSGTSVRGINVANDRPDFIICDDMQTKENSESDTESFRLLTWFTGTLLKTVTPRRPATVVYCGNMYPQNCILAKLQENQYWISLVTGCILSDGTSLWEELRSIESLYEEYKHDEILGLAYIWFAEMMNQPLLEHVSLLPQGTIPPCPYEEHELLPTYGFIIIDPAGFRKASDDNVIESFVIYENTPFCMAIESGNFNPLEVINKTIAMATKYNIRVIFIESIAYQQTLKFWFERELERLSLLSHFVLVDIQPRNRAKEGRIKVSVQQLLSNTWYLLDVEARQKYTFQALNYKIGKPKNKDDILDAAAYLEEVRTPDNWAIVNAHPLDNIEISNGELLGANVPF